MKFVDNDERVELIYYIPSFVAFRNYSFNTLIF